jgi:hypothetical protein
MAFKEPLPISHYNTLQEYKPRNDMKSPLHLFMSDMFREKTAHCEAESLRIRVVFDAAPGSNGYKNQRTPRSNVSKASRKVTLDVSDHSKKSSRWRSSNAEDKDMRSFATLDVSDHNRKSSRWQSSNAGDEDLTSLMQSRPLKYPTRPRSESKNR